MTVLLSCKSDTEKTVKDSVSKKDTFQKNEAIQNSEIKNSVLEGSWISNEDSKSQLLIKGNEWTEIYEGEKPDTYKFAFGDTCLASSGSKANPEGKYVTVFDKDGNRCFYIVTVNKSRLELSYAGRGNTLIYKKKISN